MWWLLRELIFTNWSCFSTKILCHCPDGLLYWQNRETTAFVTSLVGEALQRTRLTASLSRVYCVNSTANECWRDGHNWMWVSRTRSRSVKCTLQLRMLFRCRVRIVWRLARSKYTSVAQMLLSEFFNSTLCSTSRHCQNVIISEWTSVLEFLQSIHLAIIFSMRKTIEFVFVSVIWSRSLIVPSTQMWSLCATMRRTNVSVMFWWCCCFFGCTNDCFFQVSCVYSDHSLYQWDVTDFKRIGKVSSSLYHSACIWGIQVTQMN